MSDNYDSIGYWDHFPGGNVRGTLKVSGYELRFTYPSGELVIPRGFTLRLGGSVDYMIFVEHPTLPGLSIYTSDQQLLDDPHLLNQPEVLVQIKKLRRTKSNSGRALGCLALGLVSLILGLFAMKPFLVEYIAKQIPPEWEIQLGDLAYSQYQTQLALIEDPELQAKLDTFAGELTQHVGAQRYPFHFHIAKDAQLNAFALPGGHVILNSGTLLQAERGEEVLGILAHELAHVNRRHSIKAMIGSAGFSLMLSALVGDQTILTALLSNTASMLDERSFSRENEADADRVGLTYLRHAQLDPQGMADFFQRIKNHKETDAQAMDKLNFLSTHPTTDARIAEIEKEIATKGTQEFRSVKESFEALQASLKIKLSPEEVD